MAIVKATVVNVAIFKLILNCGSIYVRSLLKELSLEKL